MGRSLPACGVLWVPVAFESHPHKMIKEDCRGGCQGIAVMADWSLQDCKALEDCRCKLTCSSSGRGRRMYIYVYMFILHICILGVSYLCFFYDL